MRSEPGFSLVFDPEDELEHQRFLAGLHRLSLGRVVCELPPGGRGRFIAVADEILMALGKDLDATGAGRSSAESWRLLLVWLIGEGIEDLFVSRAQHTDRRQIELLFSLAAAAGLRLWLIAQVRPLRRGVREALGDWPVKELDFSEFQAAWRGSARGEGTAPEGGGREGFPEVPETDFPGFRASCRDLLEPGNFALVDQVYVRALNAAAAWTAADAETLLKRMRVELAAASSVAEAVVKLRAVQAALLGGGWFIKVDLPRLRLWVAEALRADWEAEAATRLRSYGHARRAGAATLALLSGCSPAQLASLRVRDAELQAEQGSLRLGGATVPLPDEAAGLVRALLVQRAMDGAGAKDPLLVSGWRDELSPATPKTVRLWLRKMTGETGLSLARSWNVAGEESATRAMGRAGVKAIRL